MTVVFLDPVGSLGGGERSLLDLAGALRELRPELPLRLLLGAGGPLEEEAAKLGIACDVVAMPEALRGLGDSQLKWSSQNRLLRTGRLAKAAARATAAVPRYAAQVRSHLATLRPALIHSNGLKFHLLSGYVAPRGVPVVWHLRDFLSSRPVLGRWLRRLARSPSLAVANSEAVARDARLALPGVPVETVYNGIDTGFFSPAAVDAGVLDDLAGMPHMPPGTARAGLVATYARWKGHEVFLDAAAQLAGRGIAARFYIIGGPTYLTAGSQYSSDELRRAIDERGLGDRVGLIPFQNDLRPVYRGLDVVVHASTQPEPFGRTIVEGMACGRAVVAARAGGVGELINDGANALATKPGDVDCLAAAVGRLIADPSLREALGAEARRTAVKRFDRLALGRRMLELYAQLGVAVDR